MIHLRCPFANHDHLIFKRYLLCLGLCLAFFDLRIKSMRFQGKFEYAMQV